MKKYNTSLNQFQLLITCLKLKHLIIYNLIIVIKTPKENNIEIITVYIIILIPYIVINNANFNLQNI